VLLSQRPTFAIFHMLSTRNAFLNTAECLGIGSALIYLPLGKPLFPLYRLIVRRSQNRIGIFPSLQDNGVPMLPQSVSGYLIESIPGPDLSSFKVLDDHLGEKFVGVFVPG
jgi:hypothetical protein